MHVPLRGARRSCARTGFEWLVPALRPRARHRLLRSLPKELRRSLVPVPEIAAAVLERPAAAPRAAADGAVARARAGARRARRARRVGPRAAARRTCGCASGSRTTTARAGRRGRGPRRAARARCARGCARSCPPRRPALERTRAARLGGRRAAARRDAARAPGGACAAIRRWSTRGRRWAWRLWRRRRRSRGRCGRARGGCCVLTVPSPPRSSRPARQRGPRWRSPARRTASLARGARGRAGRRVDALVARGRRPGVGRGAFAALRATLPGELADADGRGARAGRGVLDAAREVERRAGGAAAARSRRRARDVRASCGRLVHPGFITSAGVARLGDLVRYLRGGARRLDRLPDATAADRDRSGDPRARGAASRARLGRRRSAGCSRSCA